MANGDLHTDAQALEDAKRISPAICDALAELEASFSGRIGPAKYWNEHWIAVPIGVDVDLPTRGPVGGVDIREVEPIIILFERDEYPFRAPYARSNRRDFPKAALPHLNPTAPGQAASFCLHRGDINAWFAEHTITDYVNRVRDWLRDAARGRLIREEDGFEPTRPNEVDAYAIFEPRDLLEQTETWWSNNSDAAGSCALWYQLLGTEERRQVTGGTAFPVQLVAPLAFDKTEVVHRLALKINNLIFSSDHPIPDLRKQLFGILAWPARSAVSSRYFGEIPDRLEGFVRWAEELGILLTDALRSYFEHDLQLLKGIPLSIIVPRPQKLIGNDSSLEIISFVIWTDDEHAPKGTTWHPDTKITISDHRTPLTLRQARRLANSFEDSQLPPVVLFGAGALGSKIALHFARAGQTSLTLVDPAVMSPHNLVRHGLLADARGKAKVNALKEEIDKVFMNETSQIVAHVDSAAPVILGRSAVGITQGSIILDATASPLVLNVLASTELPPNARCYRAEIADMGHIGIVLSEGSNRNPRLDDLQVSLFDLAIEDNSISRWLAGAEEERNSLLGSRFEEIQVGLSCSSATMRLADDVVSFHAAAASMAVRGDLAGPKMGSFIQLTTFGSDSGIGNVQKLLMKPAAVIAARNDPSWTVRLQNGCAERLRELLRRHRPSETGGLLVGQINIKRRVIYVTRILEAPKGSFGSPFCFVRGAVGLPDEVRHIEARTGRLLGYIGEWHTHPYGGPDLSGQDNLAVADLRCSLDRVQLPTHVMIVTPRGIYPHVFMPS